MAVQFSCNTSGELPEPPQPTQTTNYTQTGGGGGFNPQIQGVTIADGGGNINMGSVFGVGGRIDQVGKERMGPLGKIHGICGGLSIVICLVGIVCAYLYRLEEWRVWFESML